MEILKPYDPSKKVKFNSTGKTRVQKHFREECDINNIMSKYQKTGLLVDPLTGLKGPKPQFGDFVSVPDYQTARNMIIESQLLFEELPSRIRARFRNSPIEFLEFVNDKGNLEEAIKLGLVEPEEKVTSARSAEDNRGDLSAGVPSVEE